MKSFEQLLEVSTKIHGHLCPGQVLGVRMSMLGLQSIGIEDPKGADAKKIYVVVEIDRCATDAIQSVTGCSLGKRSLFWVDNGIMAATFINLETDEAVRITALEESRENAKKYADTSLDKYQNQLSAYSIMPDSELFKVEKVKVEIPQENLPGKPKSRIQCGECGDWVQDKREQEVQGKKLCKNCANGRYYRVLK